MLLNIPHISVSDLLGFFTSEMLGANLDRHEIPSMVEFLGQFPIVNTFGRTIVIIDGFLGN